MIFVIYFCDLFRGPFLAFFHADFGKEFPSRTFWRGPSWDCPSPSSVLCHLLFRTEHFSMGRKGRKGAEKKGGRGVANKGAKRKKGRMKTGQFSPLLAFFRAQKRIFLFFLWGDPVQNRPQNPAPGGCLVSTRKSIDLRSQEDRILGKKSAWGRVGWTGQKKEERMRKNKVLGKWRRFEGNKKKTTIAPNFGALFWRHFYYKTILAAMMVRPQSVVWGLFLVVRIVRPTSLAIWHRGRSHRRPNRSGSPNRRHFASLNLKKHADFRTAGRHRRIFAGVFFWHFPVISDQVNGFSHR